MVPPPPKLVYVSIPSNNSRQKVSILKARVDDTLVFSPPPRALSCLIALVLGCSAARLLGLPAAHA